ncbi:hypothetical protein ACFLTY_05010 [Chloroflexota bacterium]
MGKKESLVQIVDTITGAGIRHNRALKEIRDVLDALGEFLNKYSAPADVFENIVPARVDVSTLMYRIRTRKKVFRNIKEKRLTQLLGEVYDRLEGVRVDIFNPKKGGWTLKDSLSKLRDSFQVLIKVISEIGYR